MLRQDLHSLRGHMFEQDTACRNVPLQSLHVSMFHTSRQPSCSAVNADDSGMSHRSFQSVTMPSHQTD